MIRDLDLRRRFLMQENLTQEKQQFVIAHIPPVYKINSPYLRALAGLTLISYDREHAFALLFCLSKMSPQSLRNFLNRL